MCLAGRADGADFVQVPTFSHISNPYQGFPGRIGVVFLNSNLIVADWEAPAYNQCIERRTRAFGNSSSLL
jgi:hypothetical protein